MAEKVTVQSGIYAITNTESGKVYVGSTVDLKRRLRVHKADLCGSRHKNPHLQRAWDRYSESAFQFGILEYLGQPEELHLAEQFWMNVYREEGKELYNCGPAARNPRLGCPHTKETKRKIGAANKGRAPSEKCRRRVSEAKKGKSLSKEHRRKLSAAGKGRRPTEQARRNMSAAQKGKHLSEEHKRKLATASMGNTNALGYKHAEKARRRMSEAHGRPYPSFINRHTGEVVLAGVNLKTMCLERGLSCSGMHNVKAGVSLSHKGWMLLSEHRQPRLL